MMVLLLVSLACLALAVWLPVVVRTHYYYYTRGWPRVGYMCIVIMLSPLL
jgi:hypothetical protein